MNVIALKLEQAREKRDESPDDNVKLYVVRPEPAQDTLASSRISIPPYERPVLSETMSASVRGRGRVRRAFTCLAFGIVVVAGLVAAWGIGVIDGGIMVHEVAVVAVDYKKLVELCGPLGYDRENGKGCKE